MGFSLFNNQLSIQFQREHFEINKTAIQINVNPVICDIIMKIVSLSSINFGKYVWRSFRVDRVVEFRVESDKYCVIYKEVVYS